MKKTAPVMERLLREGFFSSKEEALPFLMSGAVSVGGVPVRTGGQVVPLDKPLEVRGLGDRYVSKGGYKLEGAIADFGVTAEGRVCIDAGACTGGFTDCWLRHGARRVYAVEAGFGQLAGSLSQEPRVVNLEKTNLGDASLLALDPAPTLGSADLSYLSLVKAVPLYRAIQRGAGELLCLVKPLFEVDDSEARRTGHIASEAYAPVLRALYAALSAQPDTAVWNVTHSPVTGNNGTHEFFLHVGFGPEATARGLSRAAFAARADAAVARALELLPYHK